MLNQIFLGITTDCSLFRRGIRLRPILSPAGPPDLITLTFMWGYVKTLVNGKIGHGKWC